MKAFWEHGYAATSITQLVDATHLQPGSLYAAFDSKQGLFLAVLDHYAAGGTVTTEGPNAGDGRTSPNKSLFVHGFSWGGLRSKKITFAFTPWA